MYKQKWPWPTTSFVSLRYFIDLFFSCFSFYDVLKVKSNDQGLSLWMSSYISIFSDEFELKFSEMSQPEISRVELKKFRAESSRAGAFNFRADKNFRSVLRTTIKFQFCACIMIICNQFYDQFYELIHDKRYFWS